jgi:hypothetical protein
MVFLLYSKTQNDFTKTGQLQFTLPGSCNSNDFEPYELT